MPADNTYVYIHYANGEEWCAQLSPYLTSIWNRKEHICLWTTEDTREVERFTRGAENSDGLRNGNSAIKQIAGGRQT